MAEWFGVCGRTREGFRCAADLMGLDVEVSEEEEERAMVS